MGPAALTPREAAREAALPPPAPAEEPVPILAAPETFALTAPEPEAGDLLGPKFPSSAHLEEAVREWNARCTPTLPGVRGLTPSRTSRLRDLLRACGGLPQFGAMLDRVLASPFLTGGGPRGWRADFDFVVNPTNALKISEGRYDPTERETAALAPKKDRWTLHREAMEWEAECRGMIVTPEGTFAPKPEPAFDYDGTAEEVFR